jgi:NAD-specific glutamate dehydrogenase
MVYVNRLVDLLNGRAGAAGGGCTAAWGSTLEVGSTRHAAGRCSATSVQLGDDGVADCLKLLLLVLELLLVSQLVRVHPFNDIIAFVHDDLLVLLCDLVLELLVLHGRLHVEAVRLQAVLGGDHSSLLLVLCLVLLGIVDHALNLLLAQTTLVVGDGDLVFLVGRLLHGRHIEDAVGVNVEGDLNLRHATGCRRNSRKLELSKNVVVLGHGTLALVNLESNANSLLRPGFYTNYQFE